MWIEYLIKITCFTENTPITMHDGSTQPIASVRPGDLVYTHNGQVREVQNLQVKEHCGDLMHITAGEVLEVTPEHPLWVVSSAPHDGYRQFW
ncbi:hypothetical protein HC928_00255 [bacterium]|nr:hypothetical protein [bacterium]